MPKKRQKKRATDTYVRNNKQPITGPYCGFITKSVLQNHIDLVFFGSALYRFCIIYHRLYILYAYNINIHTRTYTPYRYTHTFDVQEIVRTHNSVTTISKLI